MSVERTERDTIAEIIETAIGAADVSHSCIGDFVSGPVADALLGVFDITPRKKEEDAK